MEAIFKKVLSMEESEFDESCGRCLALFEGFYAFLEEADKKGTAIDVLRKHRDNVDALRTKVIMEWEEAEKILSWREMQAGVYRYHGIERRGTNDYGRPISVVTLEKEWVKMYYVPASLYWDLKNRSETNFIKYEGAQTSAKGYEYPVFKFAK